MRDDRRADDGVVAPTGIRRVAGEFKPMLDMWFEMLNETEAWIICCINPTYSQFRQILECAQRSTIHNSAGTHM